MSLNEYNENVTLPNKYVLYFTASWCAPCKEIKPYVKELCDQYNVHFYMVDCNEYPDILEKYEISKVPSFYYFSNNTLVNKHTGSDKVKLLNFVLSCKE